MTRRAAMALAVLLAAGSVRAEDCPRDVPEDPAQKRHLAKKWFGKGESAAQAGNDLAALKAYQCSLAFVPHGFTAYNIGQLAEKIGDLDLAIEAYGQYLTLIPDAKDADDIRQRLQLLKERLAKVREGDKSPGIPLAELLEGPKNPPLPATAETPAPPEPTTVPGVTARKREPMSYRRMSYIIGGGGVVLALGGLVSNLLARDQMNTCNSEFQQNRRPAAESACSNAKPLAYLSYALFGVGGAAVATGLVFMFLPARPATDVALDVLPEGGLSLRYAGSF